MQPRMCHFYLAKCMLASRGIWYETDLVGLGVVLLVFWRWLVRRDMTRVNRLLLVTNEPLDGEGWLVEEVEECIWWLSWMKWWLLLYWCISDLTAIGVDEVDIWLSAADSLVLSVSSCSSSSSWAALGHKDMLTNKSLTNHITFYIEVYQKS